MKPYLKYLFEVLAIVVGITISFIVDEWREERQQIKEVKAQLVALKKTLEADRIDIERLRRIYSFRLATIQYLLELVNAPTYDFDLGPLAEYKNDFRQFESIPSGYDSIFVAQAIPWVGRRTMVFIDSKLLEEMENDGAFAILQNQEFLSDLKRYYSDANWQLVTENSMEYIQMWRESLIEEGHVFNMVDYDPINFLDNPKRIGVLRTLADQTNFIAGSSNWILLRNESLSQKIDSLLVDL